MDNMYFNASVKGNVLEVGVKGEWIITHLNEIEEVLERLCDVQEGLVVRFQCSGLRNIDTSGAWVLYKKYQSLIDQGHEAEFVGFQEKHFRIVRAVLETPKGDCPQRPFGVNATEMFIMLGEKAFHLRHHIVESMIFLGQLFIALFRVMIAPRKLRIASVVRCIHEAGLNAIPIVSLIAFLFSVVLSHQGAMQLQRFGAEVFMVNLTAVSVLREIGVLMTAILVAGRSGSAFAAEIGVMKIREELDALETMGANIFEMLIVPRVVGLIIALPLLTLIANAVGLAGGALMSYVLIDMPLSMYMERVIVAVNLGGYTGSYWIGLIKAPVFAFIIATVGTFRGLQVSGSSDSIGRYTTVAVVQSIFLIILADTIFAIIFTKIGM